MKNPLCDYSDEDLIVMIAQILNGRFTPEQTTAILDEIQRRHETFRR